MKKSNYLNISNRFISFYVFFPIYYLLSTIAWLWAKLINKRALIAKVFLNLQQEFNFDIGFLSFT